MKIRVIKEFTEIIRIDELALLVKEQMNHIGTNRNVSESSARLLTLEVDDEYVGFAFFNESWGIETGGKYI